LTTKEIPVSVGAKLLGVNRTSIYYKGAPVSEEELACKEIIDHLHTDNPAWGARQMSAQLKARGYLTAVIDWYSRCIVGWEVDDTLDTRMVICALEKAFKVAKPQIHTYNFERRHSALDYQTPAECYYPAMLLPYVA